MAYQRVRQVIITEMDGTTHHFLVDFLADPDSVVEYEDGSIGIELPQDYIEMFKVCGVRVDEIFMVTFAVEVEPQWIHLN